MAAAHGRSQSRRKQATSRSKAAPRSSPFAWRTFLLGSCAGILVCVAWYEGWFPSRIKHGLRGSSEVKQTTDKDGSEPTFEFYTVLPEKEIVVRDDEPEPGRTVSGAGQRPGSATQSGRAAEPASYMLQVGSFNALAQADRLKARLALIGVEAGVQTVKDSNGQSWYRVRVGPFASLDQARDQRARLHTEKLEAMLVKQR